jgi:putative endonuclease
MRGTNKPAHHRVGELGEQLACEYLVQQGYTIRECNARNRYGEIDIIATRAGCYHFVEVKTQSGSYAESKIEEYHPLDHLTAHKLHVLGKAIWHYRHEHGLLALDCQLDAIAVWLDEGAKHADVKYYPSLEIE